MKKILMFITAVVLLCALTACGDKQDEVVDNGAPYAGETEVQIDDRSFLLEDTPENAAEEVLASLFYYEITTQFEKTDDIYADLDVFSIFGAADRQAFEEGRYVTAYTIHRIETLSEAQYAQEFNADGTQNPLYFYLWKDYENAYTMDEYVVQEYALEEYAVVRAAYTVSLSEAAIDAGPQYGEGSYERSYLMGKSAQDETFKIYEFGEPIGLP